VPKIGRFNPEAVRTLPKAPPRTESFYRGKKRIKSGILKDAPENKPIKEERRFSEDRKTAKKRNVKQGRE
jgi:hypothetical protein